MENDTAANLYHDERLQTRAKHFILKKYLEALTYKVLRTWDVTYVDGFSGPWKTETETFEDSSFMIAIKALHKAQADILAQTQVRRKVRLFFSEQNRKSFAKLQAAVTPYHKPEDGFSIQTYCGDFEDAIPDIEKFIGPHSFPLIFIDPTGWTGFGFDRIKTLFARPKVEVLVNFMYSHVSRFAPDERESTIASLAPILGGMHWQEHLDPLLSIGLGTEKLFRQTLKDAGNFPFVLSTRIDKSTQDRPHFFLVYASKSAAGLKVFRDIEIKALREHVKARAYAKGRKKTTRTGEGDLFPDSAAEHEEAQLDAQVAKDRQAAKEDLLATLKRDGGYPFERVVVGLLQAYMLREKDVRDICVELSDERLIKNTWGAKPRKPKDGQMIELVDDR